MYTIILRYYARANSERTLLILHKAISGNFDKSESYLVSMKNAIDAGDVEACKEGGCGTDNRSSLLSDHSIVYRLAGERHQRSRGLHLRYLMSFGIHGDVAGASKFVQDLQQGGLELDNAFLAELNNVGRSAVRK